VSSECRLCYCRICLWWSVYTLLCLVSHLKYS